MKVCLATQIFSHSDVAAMRTYIAYEELPQDAEGTVLFLEVCKLKLILTTSKPQLMKFGTYNATEFCI
jgi:hypothetical protein